MILTPEKLHTEIHKRVSDGVSYVDAIIEYAEKNDIEIELLAKIVKKTPNLKTKIKEEASELKMLKEEKKEENAITDEFFK